ncbi:glycoside hydrolase family 18 [Hoylesella nanceiensis]|uniref:glycoside hydrolase family 18 n=1 Tax=Hoylesella nanceiensis TaxID=425941 RepID=UPI0028D541BA|nr:glycoside hydrolase family 18 [Hoylesella nanceiensis]
MKKLNKALLALFGGLFTLAACSDATDMELKNPADLTRSNKSEAYYAKLREYKKSDHQKAFGWFGNWTGAGVSLENSLEGLPDSVDFVSLWGNWKNLTTAQKEDLKIVQQKKGTKVLMCFLVFDIGDQITPSIPEDKAAAGTTWKQWRHEFWGWGSDKASKLAAVEKYANAICDTIDKYNYDGFDIDAEPNYAQPFATDKELWTNGDDLIQKFVETLSKRIGPKSGTGRMLVVDGEPDAFPKELGTHFDYFLLQAYNTSLDSQLDSRFKTQVDHFQGVLTTEEVAKKIIVCEDFEQHSSTGGSNFMARNGVVVPSLLGMAYWIPTYNGQTYTKGGVGTYHMEYDYGKSSANGTYKWLRQAIQIMNPSFK